MDLYQKLICEKTEKKRALIGIGKMFFPRTPVLLIDFKKNKTSFPFNDLLKGLESLGLTTFIIGQDNIKNLPSGENFHYLSNEEKEYGYKASDFVLMLSTDVAPIWEKGCIPIAQLDGKSTTDYNPLLEKGNGFYFKKPTKWEIFAAIVRALETYKFPYDWENLVKEILKKNRN